jgi:hypothetical protein
MHIENPKTSCTDFAVQTGSSVSFGVSRDIPKENWNTPKEN